MRSLKLSVLDAFDDLRTGGFARPAAEKFGGAWLACFLVMARGNVLAAFSFEHLFRASVCGIVSAAVAPLGRRRSARLQHSSVMYSRTRPTSHLSGPSRRSRPSYLEALLLPCGTPSAVGEKPLRGHTV